MAGGYALSTWVMKQQSNEIIRQMMERQRSNEQNIARLKSDLHLGKPDSVKAKELDTMEQENEKLKKQIEQLKKDLGIE